MQSGQVERVSGFYDKFVHVAGGTIMHRVKLLAYSLEICQIPSLTWKPSSQNQIPKLGDKNVNYVYL